jgi:hypothetical protein
MFSVSILSALKYDDLREELCQEFFKNASNSTSINDTDITDISKNQTNNKTDYDNQDKNKTEKNKTDDNHQIQDEKDRKNNFRLVFQKKFIHDCKVANKSKNETPVTPVVPVIPLPGQNDIDDDKDPKNPKIILPVAVSNTRYLDDADYFLDTIEELVKSIENLRSKI